jgi:hypothetical protein
MKDNPTQGEKPQQPSRASKAKRRYQKPAFRYEQVFETQALSCGKLIGSQGNCRNQHKVS